MRIIKRDTNWLIEGFFRMFEDLVQPARVMDLGTLGKKPRAIFFTFKENWTRYKLKLTTNVI